MPIAIFSSLSISWSDMVPVHLDKFSLLSFVVNDEYKTVAIIIIAPVNANGNHASGFSCPWGYSDVDAKKTP